MIVEAKGTMVDRDHVGAGGARRVLDRARTPERLYAFRDPWGVRPLCSAARRQRLRVASESCALATVGAQYLREIERRRDHSHRGRSAWNRPHRGRPGPPALCMFEYIYFARPDSMFSDRSIYMARYEMGRALAREHPVDADVVMAVPDSAIPGGIGYATESGLPYVEGLDQEPLHRAHVHQPRSERCASAACT